MRGTPETGVTALEAQSGPWTTPKTEGMPLIEEGFTAEKPERRNLDISSRVLALGAAAVLAVGVSGTSSKEASANTPLVPQNPVVTKLETKISSQIAGSTVTDSDISSGSALIRGYVNANGLSKRYKKKENCYWDRNGFWNSGVRANSPTRPKRVKDVDWFWDTRPAYICRVPKSISPTGLVKAGGSGPNGGNCRNFVDDEKPKGNILKRVPILVRNMVKAKVKVEAHSNAEVKAECRSTDGQAYSWAFGRGHGYAAASVKLRTWLKARGGGRVVSTISGEARAESTSSATADAKCAAYSSSSNETIIYQPPTPTPTPTPQPPKNPPPTGTPNPSRHRIANSGPQKECVDDIVDPDGGRVDAKDFRFVDENGDQVGGITSGVFPATPGDQTVQCVNWDPGSETQDKVFMKVTLDDYEGNKPELTSSYSFPVVND